MTLKFSRLLAFILALLCFILPVSANAQPSVKVPSYPNFVPNPDFTIESFNLSTSDVNINAQMMVGDVLYSSKTFGSSTQIVGHVGIVGPDYKIYHVTPGADADDGGIGDTLDTCMGRHGKGETIKVYRQNGNYGENAARWAMNNYRYAIVGKDFDQNEITIIYPSSFTYGNFSFRGSFIAE